MASVAKFDIWQNLNGDPKQTVINVVQTVKSDIFETSTSGTWVDVTGVSATITPNSASNKVLVMVCGACGMSGGISGAARVTRDGNPIFVGDTVSGYVSTGSASFYGGSTDGNNNEALVINYLDSPSTTNAITYQLQFNLLQGGTMRLNTLGSNISGQTYSQRSATSMILMEIQG